MLSNEKLAQLIFLLHCGVAILGHVFAVLVPIGILNLLLVNTEFTFWPKAVLLGTTFFGVMYSVNHVSNTNGFCVLTHLENHYRRQAGMPEAPIRFVPRFYKAVGHLIGRG